ncbi:MAG: NUDIX hydrolase [Xenococcaceae cyanobacterium]
MHSSDIKLLIELLEALKEEGLAAPKMPFLVWQALHGLVPLPAVEVIISQTGKDFLLTYRQDEYWDGWHIPGGFVGCGESIEGACNRIAQQELGIGVVFKRVITAYMWPNHPYANTLSLVCWCVPCTPPKEGEFFTEIPDKMVPHHADFITAFLEETKIRIDITRRLDAY